MLSLKDVPCGHFLNKPLSYATNAFVMLISHLNFLYFKNLFLSRPCVYESVVAHTKCKFVMDFNVFCDLSAAEEKNASRKRHFYALYREINFINFRSFALVLLRLSFARNRKMFPPQHKKEILEKSSHCYDAPRSLLGGKSAKWFSVNRPSRSRRNVRFLSSQHTHRMIDWPSQRTRPEIS